MEYSHGNFPKAVINHFEKLGFTVKKTIPNNVAKGTPDLFVSKGKESFYVEIKSLKDALRIDQIKWFSKHPDSILVFEDYPNKIDVQEMRKYEILEDIQEHPDKSKEELQSYIVKLKADLKIALQIGESYEVRSCIEELKRVEHT